MSTRDFQGFGFWPEIQGFEVKKPWFLSDPDASLSKRRDFGRVDDVAETIAGKAGTTKRREG
jgi:hypothetical protein